MLWKKFSYFPHLMSPETRQDVAPAHGPHSAGLSGSGFFEASNEDAKGAARHLLRPHSHMFSTILRPLLFSASPIFL